jgi:heterodisulfide reductase subunit B
VLQLSVDGRQRGLPVLHLPQLVGLALGLSPQESESPTTSCV